MTEPNKNAGTKKKYLDRYDTEDELVKAYAELERRLGEQGGEVGTLRKQFEEAQRAMTQYAEQMQALGQYKSWYDTNQSSLGLYNQWLQSGGQMQHPNAAAAPAGGGQRSLVDLLTPEEKKALFSEFVTSFDTGVFRPWQQNFAQQLQKLADDRQRDILDKMSQNQRAFTEVLWRTMQHGLPEDRVAAMRSWHEKALELGDPSKFDPMKAADDYLSMQSKMTTIEAEKKALEAEREKWQRDSLPSVQGRNGSASWTKPDDSAPKDKYERMERSFKDTKEKIGAEAFTDAFGGRK